MLQDEDDKIFGMRSLKRLLNQSRGLSAEAIKNKIVEAAYQHYGEAHQEDDVTFIVAKIE